MNKEQTVNGFTTTFTYDMKDIERENNILLKEIDKINELRIIHKEELQIKELLNRIDKAINYIMTELVDEYTIKNNGCVSGSDLPISAITPILDILKGDSNE